jgi:hypothetical protein
VLLDEDELLLGNVGDKSAIVISDGEDCFLNPLTAPFTPFDPTARIKTLTAGLLKLVWPLVVRQLPELILGAIEPYTNHTCSNSKG